MVSANFQNFVDSLPSLRRAPGAHPFDAGKMLRWLCSTGMSHGEMLAARCVLGVWNVDTNWVEQAREAGLPEPEAARRFDVLEAAAVWDPAHLAAFGKWIESPFFP